MPPIKERLPELDLALDAAIAAGNEIMKIYHTRYTIETKKDNSPVTSADLKSNGIITEILKESKYHILSEEQKDDKDRLNHKKIWIVDPLDGTKDFVEKTGEFTVMIALVKDKKPIIGVIYWPTKETVFIAQKGKGAFRYSTKWEKITVSKTSQLADAKIVASRHHLSNKEKDLFKKLEISKISSIGSSLKVAMISCASADAYLTFTNKIKQWDTCASNCIITEANGKMTDTLGNEILYNNDLVNHQNGILVTNGILHQKILNAINKV